MSDEPLHVFFYAGPGAGKSTWATGSFAAAKLAGFNVEYVPEVAKDMTWEGRHGALRHQPYVIAKQMFRYDRLRGKVDVIFSDTSTLYGLIYGNTSPAFKDWVLDDFRSRRALNIFVTRNPSVAYQTHGRRQSEESAIAMDQRILELLDVTSIEYRTIIPGLHDFSRVIDLVRDAGVQPCS